MKDISEATHQEVLQRLGQDTKERRFESIGPVIGKELRQKAFVFVALSLLAIIGYIAIAFRRVVPPVKSWHYSMSSLGALLNDLAIPIGVLALLGEWKGVQITIPIVVALLTVVGYSINNVVIVFDRVRENLAKRPGVDLRDTVNKSLRQTLTRNLNTSLTTLLVLFAIFLFGGETLKFFSLTLILGISAGIYSSLFVAPAILVWLGERKKFS